MKNIQSIKTALAAYVRFANVEEPNHCSGDLPEAYEDLCYALGLNPASDSVEALYGRGFKVIGVIADGLRLTLE